ncbi:CHAT domain-containing protein [Ilyonectria sp. MPI-CAGE-AT-0026]|nr:CHAT domain-containing protein [Ilyonectria sp. MPI-CAGE-AT-0026]
MEEAEKYLTLAREILEEADEDDDMAMILNNLGVRLGQRYTLTGSLENLDEAISVTRKAIEAAEGDSQDEASYSTNLSTWLGERHSQTGSIPDLDEAIKVAREAIELAPEDHPDLALLSGNLSAQITHRYKRFNFMEDLEESIRLTRHALQITPRGNVNRTKWLSNLGAQLNGRYGRTGSLTDLEEAITTTREAVEETAEDDPLWPMWLGNLSVLLGDRYIRTGSMSDLEEALKVSQLAVDATPEGHIERPLRLHSLSTRFNNRFSRTGAISDLDEAIRLCREIIRITPGDSPNMAGRLSFLGIQLGDRYSTTGNMEDLDEAIRISQDAAKACGAGEPDRCPILNNLGILLGCKFQHNGEMALLDESIKVAQEAVDGTPKDYPDWSRWSNNLALRLGDKFSRTGSILDLERAIEIAREVAEIIPKDHPDRPLRLSNLAHFIGLRYTYSGAATDLEEAIRFGREAVKTTPEDQPSRVVWVNNLSNRLDERFQLSGAIEDLNEAISLTKQSVEATPEFHPERPKWLSNLCFRLGERHLRTKSLADLDEAIKVGKEAVEATPIGHQDRSMRLSNLSAQLSNRYIFVGDMDNLTEAIDQAREAVRIIPKDHFFRATLLSNLGIYLADMYNRTGLLQPLEEAVEVSREAVQLTPENHPDRAKWVYNLGLRLRAQHSQTGHTADLEEFKQCFESVLGYTQAPIRTRAMAGRKLLLAMDLHHESERAYDIANTTIQLVPLLTPPSIQNKDKQYLLSEVVGITSDAAAIALHAGKGPASAIELLETGRGVLASSLRNMRADISGLQKEHPELAQTFVELRDELDLQTTKSSDTNLEDTTAPFQAKADARHNAGTQMPVLLDEIRTKPGFERFLLSASEAELRDAATDGPIVMLNVSSHRCDALIVEQSAIRVLELPHLSQSDIRNRAQDPQNPELLGWLWDMIVGPVLNDLGFKEPPSGTSWPHVWWIPTGPLVSLPIHAAGHHLEFKSETAVDRVISSYSSSIKTIMHSRQRRQHTGSGGPMKAVFVDMPVTPGQKPLHYATRETQVVRASCQSMDLEYIQPQPFKDEVSLALEECTIFHFAGHGKTDKENPLQSQLLLKDWREHPLTVGSLLEADLGSSAPFLAYLSACGTGQILDEASIDESIHLISAFQLAGFRHVIGTLWEVDDELCVRMARLTYEFLQKNGISDKNISYGLHHATRFLRDDWASGEETKLKVAQNSRVVRDACIEEEDKTTRPLWVPYVHYGA